MHFVPSPTRGADPQRLGRYDDKRVGHLLLINLVPSPTWGRWSKTGWGDIIFRSSPEGEARWGANPQRLGRYDDKRVSHLPLISLVPSPTWGRWSKTGWGDTIFRSSPEGEARWGADPQKIRRYDDKKVGYLLLMGYTSIPPYLHTSEITPHPNPLPQGARGKSLAAFNGGVHD